ncbi:pyruvate kinase PKLR-like, partial [Pseudonaja textilis]|uniref:pyruvate kinase PKLR-like n=1 Tax=Pseudonaja textilis TaxID=8673 RepID=UPI000EAA318E
TGRKEGFLRWQRRGFADLEFNSISFQYHAQSIANIREATKSLATNPLVYRPVAIALDTKGPEIRTGLIKGGENEEVELAKGSRLIVTTDPAFREQCDAQTIWVDYANLPKVVSVGGRIFIDDGLISLLVKELRKFSPTGRVDLFLQLYHSWSIL